MTCASVDSLLRLLLSGLSSRRFNAPARTQRSRYPGVNLRTRSNFEGCAYLRRSAATHPQVLQWRGRTEASSASFGGILGKSSLSRRRWLRPCRRSTPSDGTATAGRGKNRADRPTFPTRVNRQPSSSSRLVWSGLGWPNVGVDVHVPWRDGPRADLRRPGFPRAPACEATFWAVSTISTGAPACGCP